MAKYPVHKIVVSIQDANTRIELRKTEHTIICRAGSERAEDYALEEAKNLVLDFWARRWWHRRYGLTAKQFNRLVADRQIDPLGSWHFEVVSTKRIGIADTETGLMVSDERRISL